jgi:hypothetical protein
VFIHDVEDMDVDQIERGAGAANDTEGVWERLLSEGRAVKGHEYRSEHGIAYFLSHGRNNMSTKAVAAPSQCLPRQQVIDRKNPRA